MLRLFPVLALLAFTIVGCSSTATTALVAPSVDAITADELKQLVDSGEEFVFVDVRQAGEIERDGTLPNYIHIPIRDLEKRLSEIPQNKKIVVACSHGARSGHGAALLKARGFQDVSAVGMLDYQRKGYPLIHPKLSD